MIEKQAKYLAAADMPPDQYVLYRRTEDSQSLSFDIWNSKTRSWIPSEYTFNAFMRLDIYADPKEESEGPLCNLI